jgi:hypothetical protein
LLTDRDSLADRRACTDMRAGSYAHPSGQNRARGNVRMRIDLAVMFHNSAGIDDHVRT